MKWEEEINKIGKIEQVWKGATSEDRVFLVDLDEVKDYNLLITDSGNECEFSLLLPGSWDLSETGMQDLESRWPVQSLLLLIDVARNLAPSLGGVLPNGNPAAPISEVCLASHYLFMSPVLLAEKFKSLSKQIWTPFPVYEAEVEFLGKNGLGRIMAKFKQHTITEMINPKRESACRKKILGFL